MMTRGKSFPHVLEVFYLDMTKYNFPNKVFIILVLWFVIILEHVSSVQYCTVLNNIVATTKFASVSLEENITLILKLRMCKKIL